MTEPTRIDQQPLELTNAEIRLIHRFDFRANATLATILNGAEMVIEKIRPEKYLAEIKTYRDFLAQRQKINEQSISDLLAIPQPAFQQLAQILIAANEFFSSYIKQTDIFLARPDQEQLELLSQEIEKWQASIAPRFPANHTYAAFKSFVKSENLEDTRNTKQ